MGEFSNRVFDVVKRIPRGKVATYGQVACMIGSPRSARYVGYVLRTNPEPVSPEPMCPEPANPEPASHELPNFEPKTSDSEIPCHRVVFKDGHLCQGYAFGGPGVQKHLLEQEGVLFSDNNHVNLETCLWDGKDEQERYCVCQHQGYCLT